MDVIIRLIDFICNKKDLTRIFINIAVHSSGIGWLHKFIHLLVVVYSLRSDQ